MLAKKLTPHLVPQATSGFLADGRQIANRARSEISSLLDIYREPPPLKVLCT